MVRPQFNKAKGTEIYELGRETKYRIPREKGPTHASTKNDKLSFFISNDSVPYYKSTNHRRFYRIPEDPEINYIQFPQYEKRLSGSFYSEPTWL